MKFIERIKKDKSFRWKVVLIFIFAVFLIGDMIDTKKEAVSQDVCDAANTIPNLPPGIETVACGWSSSVDIQIKDNSCMPVGITFKPTDTSVTTCAQNLCKVGTESVTGPNIYGCFACVPSGLGTSIKENCCSKEADPIDDGGTYKFLCKSSGLVDPVTGLPTPNTPRPGAVCKNDAERTLAGFLDSAEFADEFTCKQKYYAVAFGGGFVTLLLLMATL